MCHYGRVTCLTYQNKRACEQYTREYSTISSTGESSIFINDFDALQYSACLAIGILFFLSISSALIYLIRNKSSQSLFSCMKKSLNTNRLPSISQQQLSSLNLSRSRYTPAPDIHDLPPSYPSFEQNTISINDFNEPPLYPGSLLFSSLPHSDSIYYETIKTPFISNPMPLPEPHAFINIQTHCV